MVDYVDTEMLVLLCIVGIVLATVIFNIVNAVKQKITRIKVVNGILFGLIVILISGQIADTIITDADDFNYDIDTSALLGSYDYVEHTDGYYIVQQSTFLGGGSRYAIPEENVHIPLLTRIYSPVKIYSKKNTNLDDGKEIYINDRRCIIAENVVKIVPEYFDLVVVTGALDILVIILYNIVEAIIGIVKIYRRKKQISV